MRFWSEPHRPLHRHLHAANRSTGADVESVRRIIGALHSPSPRPCVRGPRNPGRLRSPPQPSGVAGQPLFRAFAHPFAASRHIYPPLAALSMRPAPALHGDCPGADSHFHVACGSKPEVAADLRLFRFSPGTGHRSRRPAGPWFSARDGHRRFVMKSSAPD